MRKLLALFLLLAATGLGAQHYYMRPDFSMYADTSLAKFVTKLQYTLVTRNKTELRKVLSPQLKFSFGDEYGLDQFEKSWSLSSDTSHLWETMSRLISKGGALYGGDSMDVVNKSSVVFPTAFITLPPQGYDTSDYVTLWAENVNVREKPNATSKILLTTSYEILETYATPKYIPGWVPVRTFDKSISGWVKEELAYSPFDYRMILQKRNGTWMIVTFIAGD